MKLPHASALPGLPGTYVLVIRLDAALTLNIGRLGIHRLEAGQYLYVGSAHGPGGLRARVGRHLRPAKRPHWHIDRLTSAAPVQTVWFAAATERLECAWAHTLAALPGATLPVAGFGSSDCACPTHLFVLAPVALDVAWEALNRPAVEPIQPYR